MRHETKCGRYLIVSNVQQKSGEWTARAFRGDAMVVDVHRGATEQAAIIAVKTELEAIRSRQRAARREGYPTVEEVKAAIRVIGKIITKQQWAMLKAHVRAANHIMTATEIAAAGGYDNYEAANSQYGSLGRKLAEELEWEPPILEGKQIWTFALAEGADQEGSANPDDMNKGHWRWKLRSEVAEALRV